MRKRTFFALAIAAAVGATAVSAIYVNKVEHQSLRSKALAGLIQASGTKKRFSSEQSMEASLRDVEDSRDYRLPRKDYKSKVELERYEGIPVYTFNARPDRGQKTVLYLHGGAWVYQPTSFHWAFIDKLAQATDAKVIVPIYPKAPNHTYAETFDLLHELYRSVLEHVEDPARVTIMGDSAGGNISLLLGQRLVDWNLPQPGRFIVFSPTLDLSFTNPAIADYARRDPMLAVPGARYAASLWAGGEPLDSPLLSPLYGDFVSMAPVTMFVGTYEGGYPDSAKWDAALTEQGIEHRFYAYPKMIHVFPLYPIPEAEQAFAQIVEAMHG